MKFTTAFMCVHILLLREASALWAMQAPGPVDGDILLDLSIAVKQNADGVQQLEQALWRQSDPTDEEHYAKHLTPAEVKRLVAPAQASLDAVDAWLRDARVAAADAAKISASGDYVRVTVSIAEAERLLPGAQYVPYKEGSRTVHRVKDRHAFSLPAKLREHVDLVEPTVTLPPPKGARVQH